MSTRSIVAAEFEDGSIKGVYVHSDGYPEGQWGKLNVLSTLIKRDGVDKVIRRIMGKPNGWSSLDPDQTREFSYDSYKDGRFLAVPGYGVQFSARKMNFCGRKDYRQADTEYRVPGDGGEEYFYLIRRDGTIDWCEGDWPAPVKHFDPAKDEVPAR
jgi:hypothetical protein